MLWHGQMKSDYYTYMRVMGLLLTVLKFFEHLYINPVTNIVVANNTVYFIVFNKFAFHIFYRTFQTMCM